ncbi:unnamed protein product [Amoebophrya sp. A120]|nr:unnamed protein product [Amoebophrya sp. A120]|eukprot:GSA120T00017184001.1
MAPTSCYLVASRNMRQPNITVVPQNRLILLICIAQFFLACLPVPARLPWLRGHPRLAHSEEDAVLSALQLTSGDETGAGARSETGDETSARKIRAVQSAETSQTPTTDEYLADPDDEDAGAGPPSTLGVGDLSTIFQSPEDESADEEGSKSATDDATDKTTGTAAAGSTSGAEEQDAADETGTTGTEAAAEKADGVGAARDDVVGDSSSSTAGRTTAAATSNDENDKFSDEDDPSAQNCSLSPQNPVAIHKSQPCPQACPFAQPIAQQSCEKWCVRPENCAMFHPARSFPDLKTNQCVLPCGIDGNEIEGCVECAGLGKCKKCAVGLLGVSYYELSVDGKKCVNLASRTFHLVTSVILFLCFAFFLYLLQLQARPVTNLDALQYAMRNRWQAKWAFVFGDIRLGDLKLGRGQEEDENVANYGTNEGTGARTSGGLQSVLGEEEDEEQFFLSDDEENFPRAETSEELHFEPEIVDPTGTCSAADSELDDEENSLTVQEPQASPPDFRLGSNSHDQHQSQLQLESRTQILREHATTTSNRTARVLTSSVSSSATTTSPRVAGVGQMARSASSATTSTPKAPAKSSDSKKLSSGGPRRWWSTPVHSEDIAGKGVALYFNWLLFLMVVSLASSSIHYFTYEHSDLGAAMHSGGPLLEKSCAAPLQKDGVTPAGLGSRADASSSARSTNSTTTSPTGPASDQSESEPAKDEQAELPKETKPNTDESSNVEPKETNKLLFLMQKQVPTNPIPSGQPATQPGEEDNALPPVAKDDTDITTPPPKVIDGEQTDGDDASGSSRSNIFRRRGDENAGSMETEEDPDDYYNDDDDFSGVPPYRRDRRRYKPTLEEVLEDKFNDLAVAVRSIIQRLQDEASKWTLPANAMGGGGGANKKNVNPNVEKKYEQFHSRMFVCCGLLYFVLTFSVLIFHALQLEKLATNSCTVDGNALEDDEVDQNENPSSSKPETNRNKQMNYNTQNFSSTQVELQQTQDSPTQYCLVLENLPRHVLDGSVVSAFLEQKLTHLLNMNSTALVEGQYYAGRDLHSVADSQFLPNGTRTSSSSRTSKNSSPAAASQPQPHAVRIIGTSIAYDFYTKKEEVYEECLDWLDFSRHLADSSRRFFARSLHSGTFFNRSTSSPVQSPRSAGGGGHPGRSRSTDMLAAAAAGRVPAFSTSAGTSSESRTPANRAIEVDLSSTGAAAVAFSPVAKGAQTEVSSSKLVNQQEANKTTSSSKNTASASTSPDRTTGSRKIKLVSNTVQTDALSSKMFDTLIELDERTTKTRKLERKSQLAMLDNLFMQFVGLRENKPLPLKNTGKAYVVFERKEDAARILLLADRLHQQREYEKWKRGENLLLHRLHSPWLVRSVSSGAGGFFGTPGAAPLFRLPSSGMEVVQQPLASKSSTAQDRQMADHHAEEETSGTATTMSTRARRFFRKTLGLFSLPRIRFLSSTRTATGRATSASHRPGHQHQPQPSAEELLRIENAVLEIPLDALPAELPDSRQNSFGAVEVDRSNASTTLSSAVGNINSSTVDCTTAPGRALVYSRAFEKQYGGRQCRPRLLRTLRYSATGHEGSLSHQEGGGRATSDPSSPLGANAAPVSTDNIPPPPPPTELDFITLRKAKDDEHPLLLHWENLTSWGNFYQKIFLGVTIVLFTMFLWTALYLTYAIFYITLIPNIPGLGVDQTYLKDVLLGLLITVGNALLYFVIDRVTKQAGFSSRDSRDRAVLGFSFIGTLLNVVCDLAMVAYVARTQHLETIFSSSSTSSSGSSFVSYDQVLGQQLFALIMPGYLILPFLAAPVFEHVLPFWLSFWFIRSRSGVLQKDATEALRAKDFEIAWRYADVLNNLSICLLLFLFPGPNAWRIMLGLFLFSVLIYVIDRYLFFKQTTVTFYPTIGLANSFAYWFVVPTGILAVAVAYWGTKAFDPVEDYLTFLKYDFFNPGRQNIKDGTTGSGSFLLALNLPWSVWFCLLAVVLHVVSYLSLLRTLIRNFKAYTSLANYGQIILDGGGEQQAGRKFSSSTYSSYLFRQYLLSPGTRPKLVLPAVATAGNNVNASTNSNTASEQDPDRREVDHAAHSSTQFLKKLAQKRISQKSIATYFNTNPIYCLRSRYLGPDASGWKMVRNALHLSEKTCFPFMRGVYPNFSKF